MVFALFWASRALLWVQKKSQARWWATTIAATLEVNMTLPDPRGWSPAHVMNIYPDASSGLTTAGSGFGAVVWSQPQQITSVSLDVMQHHISLYRSTAEHIEIAFNGIT